MSSEPITDSPDPRLQAALAEYLERIDRGEAVDRAAFLAEFPDLAQELAPLLETADALEEIGGNSGESRPPDLSTHSQLSHDIETIAPGRQGQEATSSGPLPVEFGRYRTIKPLGQGAMGVVYLAEDTQLHRKVALKTSSFDNDQSGELLERFYREARSAATLRHPNICPVYDVGEIQGRHYISMAYIEGRTLASYVNASGSLHERQVLVLVRKLALALQDAHQHEIVHRDLKPANIMVDLKGEPIIMDFGLARIGYSEEESRLTQVGMIVGSPAYMSPEQVGGRPELLTGAADQYSLGVILFELLVGHPPFRGSVTAVVGQILTQPPPRLSSLRSDVSPAVEALCQKMLAKSPGERFASMKHVAEEIATLLRGSSTEKGPSGQEDRGTPATSIPKTSLHAALVDEARQRLKQRDYPKAIEMLQQIPEAERPPEAAKLLAQALKLMDEVNFVLQEMEAALQSRDGATLAKRAQELVKLKPDHPRARQVRELIKKHGPERALQFLAENSGIAPPVDRVNQRRIGLMAGGILAALLLGIVIWFGSGKTRLKVTVNDPAIEVTFRGSQLSIKDGVSQVDVEPGEQELTIRVAGIEFQTPKFSLKKGTTSVVEVERAENTLAVNLAGTELAAWPLDKAATASPATATQSVTPTAVSEGEIDLLAALNPAEMSSSLTRWERRGQSVAGTCVPKPGKTENVWRGLLFPTDISGDYEVEIEFLQRSFWLFQIDFPLQDTALRVSLSGDISELLIDPSPVDTSEPAIKSSQVRQTADTPQRLLVRVRQSGDSADIEALLNGVTFGKYQGPRSRIKLPLGIKPNLKNISSWSLCSDMSKGYIELRRAVYRPLVGASLAVGSAPVQNSLQGTREPATTIPFPQSGRFTASRPLTEVNQGEPINAYPWITPDGLSLYWTRETQNVDSTVMQATRPSTDAPFGDIKPVLRHARLASVSPDGLEIVCPFDANGDGKPEELCTSRRATTSQEFPTPQAIPSLAGLHHALGSAFSEDGLKLIVLAAPQPNTTRIIHRVERSGPGAAWGTPRAVTIPNTPSEMDKITWPSLASGKHLIFSYQDPTNRPVEWGCVADATSDSLVFANPRHMLLDGERFIVRGGRYCPATGELFYTHSGTTPPFEKLEIRVARAEAVPATPSSNPEKGWTDLFNGRDLTGWSGLTGYWKWSNGELVGTLPAPLTQRNTVLRHDRTFRDFEIEYEMKLEGDRGGNSGLQVRSELMDPAIFLASGPQVDAGGVHWGGLSGELFGNTIMQAAKPAGTIKLNDYNKFLVRCVGKHITITLNGTVTVDGDFPEIADKGIIGWQLNGRVPSTVRLRNVRIRELNQPGVGDDAEKATARVPQVVQHGLKAEVFEGRNFEKKVSERIEPNIESFLQFGHPAAESAPDNFSVRYSGWLQAPRPGKYKINVIANDGARLYVDDKLLINAWLVGFGNGDTIVDFTEQPKKIVVEHFDAEGTSWITLLWQRLDDNTLPCPIPAEAFTLSEQAAQKAPQDALNGEADSHCLTAEYFGDNSFNALLKTSRVYRTEAFWYKSAPDWWLPGNATVRYSGFVVPPQSGTYRLVAWADNHVKIRLGDEDILDVKVNQPHQVKLVDLDENTAYPIQIEFTSHGTAGYFLHWATPRDNKEVVIPRECLFATMPAAQAAIAAKRNEGWTDLFNGRDLTGWTPMGHQGWRVENGVLIGETQNAEGWLMSSSEYDNFEFDFEYRLAPGTISGVFLRASADGPVSGKEFLEVQLLDESDEVFRTMPPSHRTGALYDILEVRLIPELRPNLWHRMNIAVHDQDIRVTVNGQEVTRGKIPAGKQLRGHLGLQLSPRPQPQRCEFQKLRVRPLKDGLPAAPALVQAPKIATPDKPAVGAEAEKSPTVRDPQIVQHGLKTEFFEGRNFERKVFERIEPNVECFWEWGSPALEVPVDNFSARFSGWLRAPKSGRYKLLLSSRDGARLKIDNKTVIDNWNYHNQIAEVSLELSDDPQPIEVEMHQGDKMGWVSLHWQPVTATSPCTIPTTAYFPDLENAQLKTRQSSAERTGLVAEYFDNKFQRRLATDRVYRAEEKWLDGSPRWGLPTNSAARYTGILVPPVSGQYKLVTAAAEHIRVWIDDKPTIESRGISPPQSAVVDLEANKPYEIRVEILTSNHGAHYVHWIPPGTTKEVSIPPECLFPNKAAIRQASATPAAKPPATEKPAPQTISAAERETIERGLAKLKADDEAAGKKLLKAFDEQIEKVRSAPKLSADERVVRIKSLEDEKTLFEKHGHIPFSLAMRTETLKYLSEFSDARSNVSKVYDRLLETLTKQKKDEIASLMRTERDIALAPRVIAIWRLTHLQNKNSVDWKLWSNGSVGEPDRKFLWVLNPRTFAIYWTKPVDVRWTEFFVIRPDSLKADIYLENDQHVLVGERVAP